MSEFRGFDFFFLDELLTDEERAILPRRPRAKDCDHNMLDAIGIGLWQLTRKGER